MSINDRQDSIIEEFEIYTDWMDKYEHIISLGKELSPMDDALKTEDRLLKGCQSRVWLHAAMEDGKVRFAADSDAIITKGLIALMISVLDGATPSDIAQTEIYFIDKIGLSAHLSPTRANGLRSMVQQMKYYGVAFSTLNS